MLLYKLQVNVLMRVHHKNLTKLVGYCNYGTKALIYEYMANGNLQAHLSGLPFNLDKLIKFKKKN